MSLPPDQLDFNFVSHTTPTANDGVSRWQTERREALTKLAREMGLPLGHRADVLLRDGTRLKGQLRLADETLWVEARRDFRLQLQIDRCTFTAAEIDSCVRLD